ncbi:antiactivator of flagellar biosynthesis FleN protein [Massilia sp. MB5]|uniref:MinD/ParA family ATP-binding protein n=1 Tax=unclassified Massilia TaxID=2609279 RepID=UPI00067DF427|nr:MULTISPECIES: antiactivator of flagellar biosynthesis FleN protein [unclassified Massilia]AKU24246.1 antiactivator of flagellar biosynthesis FleN protein [Massilia sp. NR 4-1]UMR30764.1 antiactivator of flagellar biosynthesis FleN protein [Massilia sp. MB5]
MANFNFDQAEGLRRMLAGPQPRIITFLSATARDDKGSMLVNLGASLARAGNDVVLVDACDSEHGVASRLGLDGGARLLDVARQQCALNEVIQAAPQGFGVVSMTGGEARRGPDEGRRLAKAFDVLAKQSGIVIVDGEFDGEAFPVPIMASSEIVVQVSNSAESIKNAYLMIKRLSHELGRRPFGILVTGATEAEARLVYDNMAQAASRYLAVNLVSMGSVPADEYLHRAARLGRAVVDAFPLAGASVAFRQLAGRFALAAAPSLSTGSNSHF